MICEGQPGRIFEVDKKGNIVWEYISGFGNGFPLGAVIVRKEISAAFDNGMEYFNTFGGNPVIASAALATLKEVTSSILIAETLKKENIVREHLKHPFIQEIRGKGLMLAAILPSADIVNKVILQCQDEGLILFWLLFEPKAIRITPPLTISENELIKGCNIIKKVLNKVSSSYRI